MCRWCVGPLKPTVTVQEYAGAFSKLADEGNVMLHHSVDGISE